ncbi:MAG: DUF935 family protein [SAR324 cluster bacterium]|nr:DUF935 family protein [SAR324 cluster bacterium]
MARLRNTLVPWPRRFARAERNGSAPPDAAGELAWADGLFFGRVPMERWNPDDLIWRRGYGIYRRMLLDDQIRALIALKQAVITSRAWHFEPVPGDAAQEECADFFRFLLEKHLTGTVGRVFREILTSHAFGFSILEKVYEQVSWRGRSLWGIRQLKLRPPETFSFEADVHGNLTGLMQERGGVKVALPPERFIIHVNKSEVHPQYGESDLRECHRHWWAKENILKFWNIYLERMAAGFVHGRITGPLTPAEREELKQVMKNLNTQTSVITPSSVELKMVTAPTTDAFEFAVAARDKAIAKALLVPNLLGFSEQGRVGSFSQSKTQLETFFFVLNSIAESVADVLNEQLFRELGRWNFGLAEPPAFAFDPLTDGQKAEFARTWMEAVTRGSVENTPEDEAHTRALLRYPPRAIPRQQESSETNGGAENDDGQAQTAV